MMILNSAIFYNNDLMLIHVKLYKSLVLTFNLMSFPEYLKEKKLSRHDERSLNHKITLYSDHVCYSNTPYVFLSDECSCTYAWKSTRGFLH